MPSPMLFSDPEDQTDGENVGKRRSIVKRRRRFFTGLLFVHLLLLFVLFPLLFLFLESGLFNRGVERAVDIEPALLFHSVVDGIYWSLITPISQDLNGWPQTPAGRRLGRVSDVTKLLLLLVGAALVMHRNLTQDKGRR